VLGQGGVLFGTAQAGWEGYLLAQGEARFFRQSGHHGRLKDAGGNGHNANAAAGQVAGDGQGHTHHAPFGGGISSLPHLAIKGGHGGSVDDDAAFTRFVGLACGHNGRCQANDVKGADEVNLNDFGKCVERVRTVAANDFGGNGDTGAVDDALETAELGNGRIHRPLHIRL